MNARLLCFSNRGSTGLMRNRWLVNGLQPYTAFLTSGHSSNIVRQFNIHPFMHTFTHRRVDLGAPLHRRPLRDPVQSPGERGVLLPAMQPHAAQRLAGAALHRAAGRCGEGSGLPALLHAHAAPGHLLPSRPFEPPRLHGSTLQSGRLAEAFIQSDLQSLHFSEGGEAMWKGEPTVICWYSKECHTLIIARLTHSLYTTEIARIRCYTILK